MRLLVSMFGLSHLTVRGPALLGGMLYVAAAYLLCNALLNWRPLRLTVFFCLIYCPFMMDYMVAARGYGLALGFLMLAVHFLVRTILDGFAQAGLFKACAAASSLAALSLCSNFSFGYVDVSILLVFMVCYWRNGAAWGKVIRAAAVLLGSFAATAFVVCGSTLWEFQRKDLYYGARSVREMLSSLTGASFYELNPHVVNPLLASLLSALRPAVQWAFAALAIALLAILWRSRGEKWDARSTAIVRVSGVLTATVACTFAVHWLAFRLLKIPLPQDRTGIFFIPLAMLAIAAGVVALPPGRISRWLRDAALALFLFCAVYFTGCLRLRYFQNWKFDAEVKQVYWVLRNLRERYGTTQAFATWEYTSSLNFYRVLYRDEVLPPIEPSDDPLPRQCAYVLHSAWQAPFIEKEHLEIYFHGPLSDVAVAVRRSQDCKIP